MIDMELYPQDEELTTKQCAAAAKVNRRTIVTWIRRGILPATRRPGKRGHYRVLWQHLYQTLHTPVMREDKEIPGV